MKIKFSILLLISFFVSSCSLDNDEPIQSDASKAKVLQWHLTNVSGGFAGVDIDYETDTIIWVFSVFDENGSGTLLVQNNNTDDSLEDGLASGNYSVFVAEYNEQAILFIDGEEYAGFSNQTEDILVINKNINSKEATGADGFIYTFNRRVLTTD